MQHVLVSHAAMLEICLMIVVSLVYAVLSGVISFIMSSFTCTASACEISQIASCMSKLVAWPGPACQLLESQKSVC